MLYYFLFPLREYFSAFNIFRYITFRTAGAVGTALILTLIIGPFIIRFLKKLSFGQIIRNDGPSTHHIKQGTPTMGGVFIIFSILFSILLWGRLDDAKIILLIISLLALGLVGFFDDYLKVVKKNTKGLNGWYKIFVQAIIGGIVGIYLYAYDNSIFMMVLTPNAVNGMFEGVRASSIDTSHIFVPFFGMLSINLHLLYIPFAMFVVISMSNAVNLADGLDGLAIGLLIIMSIALALISYVSGHSFISAYLKIPYINNAGEITVFLGALIGASLGFLWYNAHPAEVFMGDVGSLSLGGVLGIVALFLKHELLLILIAGVYVAEAGSVIIQVASYKLFKKRVFLMSPLHHHFEMKGWKETQVVVRFYIVGIILAIISLASLKIR